jgi:hypothetical protein
MFEARHNGSFVGWAPEEEQLKEILTHLPPEEVTIGPAKPFELHASAEGEAIIDTFGSLEEAEAAKAVFAAQIGRDGKSRFPELTIRGEAPPKEEEVSEEIPLAVLVDTADTAEGVPASEVPTDPAPPEPPPAA